MKLSITYFAVLREARGVANETVETDASTAGELYARLKERYGFRLPSSNVGVAIAGEFRAMDTALHDGDEIVFIPPVAGG